MRQPHTSIPLACAMALAVALVWLPFMTKAAYPHTTATGQTFSQYCCNGRDCQEIPKSSVVIDPTTNLVHVTLNVGDHPEVTRPHKFTFAYSKVNWSIDGLYYACLYPDEDTLRCLYLPPPSF